MIESMVTILRPGFVGQDMHRQPITPVLADYIEVPRLSTFGTWEIVNLLPFEQLARLSIFRDSLAGIKRRK